MLDDSATRLALCVIDRTSVFDDQIARTRDILAGQGRRQRGRAVRR
ncbi:hypothetical protein OG226_44255 [Streptomyces sp. NBC_01261]|nr:hypothetical protein [Streptomyces sp. NBC_01261]